MPPMHIRFFDKGDLIAIDFPLTRIEEGEVPNQ